jgi:transketolase
MAEIEKLEQLANRIRINVVKMVANAGSGHLGGSMSEVDILAVLYGSVMRFDP